MTAPRITLQRPKKAPPLKRLPVTRPNQRPVRAMPPVKRTPSPVAPAPKRPAPIVQPKPPRR